MTQRPFPLDFATLVPDTRPRRWLVLPDGFDAQAQADQTSPIYAGTAAQVQAAFVALALGEPRTETVREAEGQVELVQRSKVFRFPDYITLQAFDVAGGAALAIYSRAVIGYSDMGVNRKRIVAWLDALSAKLA